MKLLQKIKRLEKKANVNFIVVGSTLFISACALIISVQEIISAQQKATMYP